MLDTVKDILVDLTGQSPLFENDYEEAVQKLFDSSGLGYSQLNELLLLLGYDRIEKPFFQCLLDKTAFYQGGAFTTPAMLRSGVDQFRTFAVLRFGNIRFAFKYLSVLDEEGLDLELSLLDPVELESFSKRHDPVIPIDPIPGEQTYLLGYLVERELKDRLAKNASDLEAKNLLEKRAKVVAVGERNHEAYLASDHMDVYVATSMRERHEYQAISQIVNEVFSDQSLVGLKIRWFDPTQASCVDRIDKGLAEGLMLKRAICTLYLAQESDTLGKDSELACTLAQGKPVIAYVPEITKESQDHCIDALIAIIRKGRPDADEHAIVLDQMRVFCPEAAWNDNEVKTWVANPMAMDLAAAKQKLGDRIREHYDKRARTLKESHPLGIQVHLETGVANGVLVARTTTQCALLIRQVLTNTLDFKLCPKEINGNRYLLLMEAVTGSIFRVATGDRFLANVFWNYYLPK
ncbi:MAG: hypothetical protein SGJ20_04285 [Planctomycetota bacterium]|nr:hypothetical protein [Planctomycetota bacterium]